MITPKKIVLAGIVMCLGLACLFFLRRTHQDFYFKGTRDLNKLYDYLESEPPQEFDLPDFVYIAHAGGGMNGETYLNNRESIENSIKKGINFIEIDFHYSNDSVVLACHYYVEKSASEFVKDQSKGTRMTLDSLMGWLQRHDVMLITDIKTDNIKILKMIAANYPNLMTKIIPQAYTIPEIIEIKKMGFEKIIYTNYISRYPNTTIIRLAETKCLFAITLPYNINVKLLNHFRGFDKIETPIFTNTLNDSSLVSDLRASGLRGIYTDELLFPSPQ